MTAVDLKPQALQRFRPIIGSDQVARATRAGRALRDRLGDRIIWNVNSTAVGGGVAEMLRALLPYARGLGQDARWVVLEGNPTFFHLTKRLHHALHGSRGDGSPLGEDERAVYEQTMLANLAALAPAIRRGDVVILHDPQTAGLAPALMAAGALVVWRCHIGHDAVDAEVERGWRFLAPYLRHVPAFVFSRAAYVPAFCNDGRATIITPSIDAFSVKNQEMRAAMVHAILVRAGLVGGDPGLAPPTFRADDGRVREVHRRAEVLRLGAPPAPDVPLVVQVSRWDPLKDPVGVLEGFASLARMGVPRDAHLVLAGPDVSAVADDPEGAQVFRAVVAAWQALPLDIRRRVHLASLPMDDIDENAAIVNALQRHATIVVQKSLQEGFGLTVTEAMWKGRPVVASAVGGIRDQIVDGVHGLLIRNPSDPRAFAGALRHLLDVPSYARRLGEYARERVRERFLGVQHLMRYVELLDRLDRGRLSAPAIRPVAARPGRVAAAGSA